MSLFDVSDDDFLDSEASEGNDNGVFFSSTGGLSEAPAEREGRKIANSKDSRFGASIATALEIRKRDREERDRDRVQRQRLEEQLHPELVRKDREVGVFLTSSYREALKCRLNSEEPSSGAGSVEPLDSLNAFFQRIGIDFDDDKKEELRTSPTLALPLAQNEKLSSAMELASSEVRGRKSKQYKTAPDNLVQHTFKGKFISPLDRVRTAVEVQLGTIRTLVSLTRKSEARLRSSLIC